MTLQGCLTWPSDKSGFIPYWWSHTSIFFSLHLVLLTLSSLCTCLCLSCKEAGALVCLSFKVTRPRIGNWVYTAKFAKWHGGGFPWREPHFQIVSSECAEFSSWLLGRFCNLGKCLQESAFSISEWVIDYMLSCSERKSILTRLMQLLSVFL